MTLRQFAEALLKESPEKLDKALTFGGGRELDGFTVIDNYGMVSILKLYNPPEYNQPDEDA